MIDIHAHIIPYIDDGSPSMEKSLELISLAIDQGITNIICTPHFNRGIFNNKKNIIEQNFLTLKNEIKKLNLPINLYLGQEIKYDENIKNNLLNNQLLTINNTKYVLLEFSTRKETDITEIVYEYNISGYTVIVAHIERYPYIYDINKIMEIKSHQGLIQVNASAIIGKDGIKTKRFIKKLIKENLIDFVASDIHSDREYDFQKAYKYVSKKFNKEVAHNLFKNNALRLFEINEDEAIA